MTSQALKRDIACIIWTSGSDRNVPNNFRNEGAAVKLGFFTFGTSQSFRSCEMRVTVLRSGTHVPKLSFAAAKSSAEWSFPCEMGSFMLWNFAAVSQLRNGSHCAAKWHSCAKSDFRRDFYSVAEWFGNKMPISQRLRNLADPCFSPVFRSVWLRFCSDFAPIFFLQFLCNSSWFWSSKNLYYIKTN